MKESRIIRLYRDGYGPFEIWKRTGADPKEQKIIIERKAQAFSQHYKEWTEKERMRLSPQLRLLEPAGKSTIEQHSMRRLVPLFSGHMFFLSVKHPEPGVERIADGISICPKTHSIHTYEVKSCRNDLVHELNNPQKSEPFRKISHCWWLVMVGCRFEYNDLPIPEYAGVIEGHLDSDIQIVQHPRVNEIGKDIDIRFLISLMNAMPNQRAIESIVVENARLREEILENIPC